MKRHDLAFCLFLCVCTLCLYQPTLGYDFVSFDDNINIITNELHRSPSWESLKEMFVGSGPMLRYLPLSWLAWSFVHAWTGLEPFGYHAANMILHCGSTLLLFVLLKEILSEARSSTPENELWISFCAASAAAFWSWHPLRVELVAWVSGFLYLHASFWMLASAFCHLRAIRHFKDHGRWNAWLPAGLLAYLLSLLSYPICIGFPAVLLAWTLWQLATPIKTRGTVFRDRLGPWLGVLGASLLAFAFAVLAVIIRFTKTAPSMDATGINDFPLHHRLIQALYVIAHSLWKTLIPNSLSPAYSDLLSIQPMAPRFLAATLVMLLLLAALVIAGRKYKAIWLLGTAFLGLQGPFLGLLEHPFFPCDRYSYLPGLVLACALALMLSSVKKDGGRLFTLGALALGLIVSLHLNNAQQAIWTNTDTLFPAISSRSANRAMALNYTLLYQNNLELEGRDRPTPGPLPTSLYFRASKAIGQGRQWESEQLLLRALHYFPDFPKARYNLAQLFVSQGRCREAVSQYLILKSSPGSEIQSANMDILLHRIADACRLQGPTPLATAVKAELRRDPWAVAANHPR